MTIPTTDQTTRHHDQPTAAKEQWISSLTDIVTVHPWYDPVVEANPLAVPTASDEAVITGRVGLFVPCECFSGGVS